MIRVWIPVPTFKAIDGFAWYHEDKYILDGIKKKRFPGCNDLNAANKIRLKGRRKNGKPKGTVYDQMKRSWTTYCRNRFLKAGLTTMDAVSIRFFWVEKDRRRDPDNISHFDKIVIDGLVWAGVIKNDGQRQIKSIHHAEIQVSDKPGVLVCLFEWPEKL